MIRSHRQRLRCVRVASSRSAVVFGVSGSEESGDGRGGFVDLGVAFVLASRGGFPDAVPNVFVQETDSDALKRFGDGADLGEHVDAVFVFVDHALESADLAFDLGESRGVVVFGE